MSTWNDPGKLEEAMKTVVESVTLAVTSAEAAIDRTTVAVLTGMDDDDIELPFVACAVVGAGEEIVIGTGIVRSTVRVSVHSSAQEVTLAEQRARAAAVFDAFFQDAIRTTLSDAVDDFHVWDVKFNSPEPTRRDSTGEDTFKFVTELTMEVVWCGSDIS